MFFCGSEGSKCSLAKAADAEASGRMRDQKLHADVAKHVLKSKCYVKNTSGSQHFWYTFSRVVGKVHAVVARCTFPRQHVNNTSVLEYFGTFGMLSC